MSELKLCPFCGGKAEQSTSYGWCSVSCLSCGAHMFPRNGKENDWELNQKDWNKRAGGKQIRNQVVDKVLKVI